MNIELWRKGIIIVIGITIAAVQSIIGQVSISADGRYNYTHPITHTPATYVCYSLDQQPEIDGIIDEAWEDIPWTSDFVDIQGNLKSLPALKTRAKMAWDDDYFYIAAELMEPHIWATLTERDAIMYHDDDFEIFIDPDGDGHNYFEFEMNAFNAIWDLLMLYPYNVDNGRNYLMNWDIRDIRSAVHINGTLNNPTDTDDSWTVEVALPWSAFKDLMPRGSKPSAGDQWRINFSRVDWTMDVDSDTYVKVKDQNGKTLPEDNWVWSPTGYINMHKPETWGYVQFADDSNANFQENPDEHIKWALWQLYYQVRQCTQDHSSDLSETCTIEKFTVPEVDIPDYVFSTQIEVNKYGFYIQVHDIKGRVLIIDNHARLSIK